MTEGYDVFLSHSTASNDVSRDLTQELRAQGMTVFFDQDSLFGGSSIEEEIRRALESSRAVVVVLDSSSTSSPWTAFEAGAAIGMGKPVVPVMVRGVSSGQIPSPLRHLAIVTLRSAEEAAVEIKAIVQKSTGE